MINSIPVAYVLVGSIYKATTPHCVYVCQAGESPIMEFYAKEKEARDRYDFVLRPEVFSEVDAVLLFINKMLVEERIKNTVMIHFDKEN